MYYGLDAAASEFYKDGKYNLTGEGKRLLPEQMTEFWADWAARYPILTIEDGMDESDWEWLEIVE